MKPRSAFGPIVLAAIVCASLFLIFFFSRPIPKTTNQLKVESESEHRKVKRVIDGDTIELDDGRRVRYLGIDAPEITHETELRVTNQESGKGEDECYGKEAKKINEDLVLGKKVRLEFDSNKYDRYGRTLAWVYNPELPSRIRRLADTNNGEISVNERLIRVGAARFYWSPIPLDHTSQLIEAEEQARKERVGLWGKCGKIDGQCLVKGNLDRNDKRYYHLPGFKYYEATEVNPQHGDRWFCSEEDAQKAGFKRAVE